MLSLMNSAFVFYPTDHADFVQVFNSGPGPSEIKVDHDHPELTTVLAATGCVRAVLHLPDV